MPYRSAISALLALAFGVAAVAPMAHAQPAAKPPAVGVVDAKKTAFYQSDQFVGRIQAIDRVGLVARVTAFLDQQLFKEGSEVKKGDLLYTLEKAPFEADVQSKAAAVQQAQAQLSNAQTALGRAQALLSTPAGQRSVYDDAKATMLSDQANVLAAQANLRSAQINLGYTDIKAPIAGKIGATSVTTGNVVSPSSGVLATIVSQDPMYVTFPISVREGLTLRHRYAPKGGVNAVVIKVELPDGRMYGQTGKLSFVNNTVSATTDTITLRGTIANPLLPYNTTGSTTRELVDGEFVTVILQGVNPIQALTIPRSAVLSDQQGDYVYTVDSENKAQRTNVKLGESNDAVAVVLAGLNEGQKVIVDGIQRVHQPGQVVTPAPAAPTPESASKAPAEQ